ncbi:hypothetical protein [Nannocystis punicea]|uniref:Uncharacterized protein n=1 Tax=Nannocystis punicea TaxID=2995304 RepID=A0ABY7H0E7_9BACT|nr:hypothetical protein [Nannocystis poenicansa]WAS92600.1 hypothetical protein O0S08_40995 [Nannocystis poenicansa]
MFDSVVLDIAIGLIFVFLATSLAITAGNELLASLFKWRAKDLAAGLRLLVGKEDGAGQASQPDITRALYQHPLLRGLHGDAATGGDSKAPSYIPPRMFAMALLDIALRPADGTGQLVAGNIAEMRAQIETKRGELGNRVTDTLLTFVNHVEVDARAGVDKLGRLQRDVEAWFNAGMGRVSEVYRRRAQLWSSLLAIFFVAALNLDAIRITRSLANDPVLRASLIAQATEAVKQEDPSARLTQAATPPAEDPNKALPTPPAETAPSATAGALRQLQTDISTINQLGIPVGWEDNPPQPGVWWWVNKVLGLLLTGLAASLGAPFWFDVLKKVSSLRAAGRMPPPPDTSNAPRDQPGPA